MSVCTCGKTQPLRFGLAVLLGLAVQGAAADQEATGPRDPVALEELRAKGAETVPLGELGGVRGWLVRLADGPEYALYELPSGGLLAGLLYDADGTLLTAGQLEAAGVDVPGNGLAPVGGEPAALTGKALVEETVPAPVEPGEPGVDRLLARTETLGGFTLGDPDAPLRIQTFVDPLCPFSRTWVASLSVAASTGRLSARVIPVAILGPDSVHQAATIAGAPVPASAWAAPDRVLNADIAAGTRRVAEAIDVLNGWRADAVPFTLYSGPSGEVRVVVGAVDPDTLLREAGILP